MGLYRRGKFFWFSITYQGKRIQESFKTDNRKLAEKLYAKVLTDIVEGRYFETAKAKKIKFQDMTEKYLEEHAHSRDSLSVKTLLMFFSGYMVAQITTKAIAEYRNMRLKSVKPATVYQELALLRRMFNVAIKEWEWCKDNPVSRLSFSVGNRNARTRWLTMEEEKSLLEKATNPDWLRSLLTVALHTGIRRGEILDLRWQNVDLLKRLIRVVKSKNGEKRSIPMSNTLFNVFKGMNVRDISGRVFPISKSSIRHAFDKVVEKVNLEDFRFHDLRHSFATRLVQNGVDLYKVKELLGHKTITMTMRYAHHYPESLRSSVEVLDHCYNSATFGVMSN
ncbi:MAG: tyrosine-type recombinase/integrase [Candidatus Aenigmarchaeota archaeon]|nr:tyrosine-type recombinase/integrase [Candidatus Aenigmarchaeota archaeon]